jgi:serine/threonine protein kinase
VITSRANIYAYVRLNPHQDHPNIVRLEEVYESHSEIYLVQEVCKGGELFDRLDEQPDYRYTEAQVCAVCYCMLCAIARTYEMPFFTIHSPIPPPPLPFSVLAS